MATETLELMVALDKDGRVIHPANATEGEYDSEASSATHWMYQEGENWVAVEGWDADLSNWWAGSSVAPAEWMRQPIQQLPTFGTLVYTVEDAKMLVNVEQATC